MRGIRGASRGECLAELMAMHAALVSLIFAAAPVTGAPTPRVYQETSGQLMFTSIPQIRHLMVDATVGALDDVAVVFGGWNTFDLTRNDYLRGGYVGVRYAILQDDTVGLRATVRGLLGQPWDGENRKSVGPKIVEGGFTASVESKIRLLRVMSVSPSLELFWLPRLTVGKLATEVSFTVSEFNFGAVFGLQGFFVGPDITIAFAAGITIRWIHSFGPASLVILAAGAVGRDPSFLTSTPIVRSPTDGMQVYGQLGLGVIFNRVRK